VAGQPTDSSRFGAAGSALGYLAQVDYALLAALERMDDEDDFTLSIETLDDIVFHHAETDNATEKWQSKHTIESNRTLSDASTDLWKTFHNWIVEPGDGNARLVLLSVANAGNAAAKLRVGEGRDVQAALQALERTARESTSSANADYYAAFLALDPSARRAFLERIEVVDGAVTAATVQSSLERAVRKSVKPLRRAALVERLRGWWHKRAIAHLDAVAHQQGDRITSAELEEQLLEIADSLRDENLPIDVLDMPEPSDEEVSESDRIFVAQLRLVAMSSERLRKCIYDHNRAFAQRSIWQRDRLLEIGELGRYDQELKEAWERFFLPAGDEDPVDESEVLRLARERFVELDRSDLAPIRRDVRQGWVARGSLHVIADRLEIGWHPDWLDHLRHRLAEVRDEPASGQAA
jgi:ABC-3C protein